MTNHDGISAHELFTKAASQAFDTVEQMNELESTLRKAVIREASVGEITVRVRESGDELSRPGDPNRIVTASEQFICQTWIPEGTYALVKEAT